MKPDYVSQMGHSLRSYLQYQTGKDRVSIEDADLGTIKVHFIASNILRVDIQRLPDGRVLEFMMLTDIGHQKLLESKAVRKPD